MNDTHWKGHDVEMATSVGGVRAFLAPEAEEHLTAAYFQRRWARDLARVRLMKIVSDAREAMWAVVQQGISTIDFDYRSYADEHFERLLTNASTPEYRRWLEKAGA